MESRDSEGGLFASLDTDTRKKITDCNNAIIFDLRRKITKLSRKNVNEHWRHQALGRLELTLVVNTSF